MPMIYVNDEISKKLETINKTKGKAISEIIDNINFLYDLLVAELNVKNLSQVIQLRLRKIDANMRGL